MLNSGHAVERAGALAEIEALLPSREVLLFPRGPIALPATIHVAGVDRQHAGKPYDHDGLRRGPRSFVLLQHTLAGSGRLRFEDRHFTLGAGQTMLITVPHDHRYWLPQAGDWSFFWLCLHGHEALHICKHVIDELGPVIRLSDETLAAIASIALEVLQGRVATPMRSSTLAYDLVMRLLAATGQQPTAAARERPPEFEQAISFCRNNLDRPIGVGDLARASGYSRYHFVRRFRETEGISPSEFIRGERLSRGVR
ncbi:MAG: AraC family transcriptional regulator, partial [Bauldia sp.]